MTRIHRLRKLGANESGEKAGVEFARDHLRLEGLLDADGHLRERPHVLIEYERNGEWYLTLLDDTEIPDLDRY